jgi:hypothetical protein
MGLRMLLVVKRVAMFLYNRKLTSVYGNYLTTLQYIKQQNIQNKNN